MFHSMVILSVILLIAGSYGARRKTSDSIMDIMNTRHIERTLAERRMNATRLAEEKRLLTQNDLEEDVPDTESPDLYPSPEIAIDFDLNSRQNDQQHQQQRPMDILMRYNDTVIPLYAPFMQQQQQKPLNQPIDADLMADLQSYRVDKLLKSSKNALFVTRKEYLKKDWCKTEPLVQRIREDGCLSKNIINRFCYGQCNSFYIPKSPKRTRSSNRLKRLRNSLDEFEPEDLTGAAFRSCAFCKPKKFTWITVTLRCPSLMPQLRRKKIQRIKQCKCIAEQLN